MSLTKVNITSMHYNKISRHFINIKQNSQAFHQFKTIYPGISSIFNKISRHFINTKQNSQAFHQF